MQPWEKKMWIDPGHLRKLINRGLGSDLPSIINSIRELLRNGIVFDNPQLKPAKKICIAYFDKRACFFTIPFTESDIFVVVYSAVPSKQSEIEMYKKFLMLKKGVDDGNEMH